MQCQGTCCVYASIITLFESSNYHYKQTSCSAVELLDLKTVGTVIQDVRYILVGLKWSQERYCWLLYYHRYEYFVGLICEVESRDLHFALLPKNEICGLYRELRGLQ